MNKPAENGCTPLFAASNGGHVQIVRLLLAQPNINTTIPTEHGSTLESESQRLGHMEIVALLQQHNAGKR